MKVTPVAIAVLLFSFLLTANNVEARRKGLGSLGKGTLGIGGQYHNQHSAFDELPFVDEDITYGLAYFTGNRERTMMIAATYGADIGGTNEVDYTITPQLNLLLRDDAWRAGTGVLSTYTKLENGDDDWLDIYFQFILGFSVPVGDFSLDLHGIYQFEGWDRLDEFEFSDIQYGAWLSRGF